MLLFVDESGHDFQNAPYYVLGGIALHPDHMWDFIRDILNAEKKWFGMPLREANTEIKGNKLLSRKTFKWANQDNYVDERDIPKLASRFIRKGQKDVQEYTSDEFKSFGLARIRFTRDLFNLCHRYNATGFASIVEEQELFEPDRIRKDYGYLFERYNHFMQSLQESNKYEKGSNSGLIVFDELDKSQSHILLDQMREYFLETQTGQRRAKNIVPEPFFVHSDLSKLIQVADVFCYVLNWGFRLPEQGMDEPIREEIKEIFDRRVWNLNYHGTKEVDGETYTLYGYKYIDDLRTVRERKKEGNDPG